eukprot:2904409-Amphidinium_carterae.1
MEPDSCDSREGSASLASVPRGETAASIQDTRACECCLVAQILILTANSTSLGPQKDCGCDVVDSKFF